MLERDVPETDGRDERHRRMPLRGKAKTDGPSVIMSFHLGDICLCHSSWPSQSGRQTSPRRMAPRRKALRRMSPRWMAPRRMSPRRRKAETDAPDTDVPETDGAETDAPETDVLETEGVLLLFLNIVEGLSECYCLINFVYESSDV